MTSQLNVDTIVDKAGSGGSNVKMANTSTYVSDGGATTQNTVQGLAKSWINYEQAGTFAINDSFNISSVNDDGAGLGDTNYTNNFNNANYAAAGASSRVTATNQNAYWTFPTRGSNTVYSTSSTSWTSGYNPSSDALTAYDCVLNIISIHGDLA
jgi:hypothetical protein